MTGFMTTSETLVVVASVNKDVFLVLALQLGNAFVNRLHTSSRFASFNGRNVGVTPSTVPITFKRFRMKRNLYTKFLCNSFKEITCHPKMITHLNTLTWTNLKFPLRRHDFSVNTTDFDATVQTRFVMRFNDITSVNFARSNTAIVWTLWAWKSAGWPAVWSTQSIEESIFLFETEPRIVFLVFLHEFVTF